MVIPAYLGLLENLKSLQASSRYNLTIILALHQSLQKRLGHVIDDSFFCVSTVLDPSFKMKWCDNEEKKVAVKQMNLSKSLLVLLIILQAVPMLTKVHHLLKKKLDYLLLWIHPQFQKQVVKLKLT